MQASFLSAYFSLVAEGSVQTCMQGLCLRNQTVTSRAEQ